MIQLPEGWESHDSGCVAFVYAPSSAGPAAVCIDYESRGFRRGDRRQGPLLATAWGDPLPVFSGVYVYRGRGWRERLEADAVEWLRRSLEGGKC